MLKAGVGAAVFSSLPTISAFALDVTRKQSSPAFSPSFISVPKGYSENLALTYGYKAQTLLRWGDALSGDGAPFIPSELTAETQQERFGYNNDFIAYLPIKGSSSHGLLHVNHEYTNAHLMFSGTAKNTSNETLSEEQMRIEQQAQGFSTIEVKRDEAGQWQIVPNSRYSQRTTATSPIRVSGPAAGNARLKTKADPQGLTVQGTFANCAGGVTPWGTVLVSEENIDGYFGGEVEGAEARNHQRYTIAEKTYYGWQRMDPRFDVSQTPNEPNRFGWVVEYDPFDPLSQPVKRTALGRFKHESATCAIAPDGRLVVYSGDDDYFEYIYRFVSRDKVNETNRKANRNLLDNGTLFVAKFHENGELEWIPLRFGERGLTAKNGFYSQADVLIESRRAGDVVGATKMDRPEGIAVHPHSGGVYVSLTRNPKRKKTNAANPRSQNVDGHIIHMQLKNGDHAADKFKWNIMLMSGDPDQDSPNYGERVSPSGWFGSPDNLAFHPSGCLWIATDGMPKSYGVADGLYATNAMRTPKCFLRAPKGAEVTGPCFTPDGETLFLAIQHPGEDKGSTFDAPSTRWPDFSPDMPPRPSVIVVTKA